MCSELLRIPYSWGGVPIFGFGVLVVVWAVVGLGGLALAVRRNGFGAETWSLVPLLVFSLVAIIGLPKLFPGGMPVRGYGVMVLLGATAGVAMASYRAQRVGLNPELIWSLAVWLFVGGMIGARLFYVIEYWDAKFRSDSLATTIGRVLDFPQGGLVVYGALFGGAVGAWLFLRKHQLPVLATADLIAPSMAIGLALGRVGCLLNGCCYGGASELPWAVSFPPASPPYEDQVQHGEMYGFRLTKDERQRPVVARIAAGWSTVTSHLPAGEVVSRINEVATPRFLDAQEAVARAFAMQQPLVLEFESGQAIELPAASPPASSRPVHPTQIYASITAGLLGWLLWSYYPLRRRDGQAVALMLILYPVSRFMEEIIRTDEPAVFGTGLSISQNISVGLFVVGVALWLYLSRRPARLVWPMPKAM